MVDLNTLAPTPYSPHPHPPPCTPWGQSLFHCHTKSRYFCLWQSKRDKITKFKLKCAKCKLKGAKGHNCTNSRVQKVKTANSRVQKYIGHGSCKISILLCSTSPFQNLEVRTSTAFAPLSLQHWPFAPFHVQTLYFYTLALEFCHISTVWIVISVWVIHSMHQRNFLDWYDSFSSLPGLQEQSSFSGYQ